MREMSIFLLLPPRLIARDAGQPLVFCAHHLLRRTVREDTVLRRRDGTSSTAGRDIPRH